MLVVVSDTHNTDGHRLTDRTPDAVREVDLVVHAGDFMCESVLDAFVDEADSFFAVYGNDDGPEICDRISAARNVIYGGVEFAVAHTRRGGNTVPSMFGREHGADAVAFGYSHRSGFHGTGSIPPLNPGGHAQPRGSRKAYAELEELPDGGLRGWLATVDDETFEAFRIVLDE